MSLKIKRLPAALVTFLRRITVRPMDWPIFMKIFVTMALVSSLALSALFSLSQHYFKQILTNMEMERIQRSLDQTTHNLDSHLDKIVKDMFQFVAYSNNGSFLLRADVQGVLTEDMARAAQLLASFRLRYPGDVETAFFFRSDGVFFHEYGFSRLTGDYKNQHWYRSFLNRNGNIWSEPTEEAMFHQDYSKRTLYLTMGMYDVERVDGIFVIRLSSALFQSAFIHLVNPDLRVKLINQAGETIYSSYTEFASPEDASWVQMKAPLKTNGFEAVIEINQHAIEHKVQKAETINAVAIAGVVIASFVLSLLLSLTLSRPVKKLLSLMRRVEKGDFDVRFPVRHRDEIGMMGHGFNQMVSRLSGLIHQVYSIRMEKMASELRQKDAIIKAMQSQINPHFLYNTLEAVNCHAIVNEIPSISRMSKALADFFRYSIEKQQVQVTLWQEIRHVETYLQIQQERYPEIRVELDVPAVLHNCPIVKLTLQPLIENSFTHGFLGLKDYYVRVTGDVTQAGYQLVVEDNGEGMTTEQMTKLNASISLQAVDRDLLEMTEDRRGIGVINVHARLRLLFGEPYGLHFSPAEERGVRVVITLPLELPDRTE